MFGYHNLENVIRFYVHRKTIWYYNLPLRQFEVLGLVLEGLPCFWSDLLPSEIKTSWGFNVQTEVNSIRSSLRVDYHALLQGFYRKDIRKFNLLDF